MAPPGLDIYLYEPMAASTERLVYHLPSNRPRAASQGLTLEEAVEGLPPI